MSTRRSLKIFAVAWLACAVWLGCNAILGNESAEFDPDAAARFDATTGDGTSTTDGNGSTDGTAGDGSSNVDGAGDGASEDGGEDANPCVDLASNPRHCGSCGHDCAGGDCVDGGCKPFILATDIPGPQTIAIDGTHLYWLNSESNDVWSVQLDGGGKARLYDGPDAGSATSLALYGGNIYFGSVGDLDASILRCATPACDGGPAAELENLDVPVSVATTATGALVFAQTTFSGSVEKCQLPCTVGTVVIASGSAQRFPNNVTVAPDGTLIWSKSNPGLGSLQAQPPGGNPSTIADGLITVVTAGFGEAYYIDEGPDAGAYGVPLDGGPPRVLRAGVSGAKHLAVDMTSLYLSETSTSRVVACNRITGCGSGMVVIADQQTTPGGIIVTPQFIYWAVEGNAGTGGRIMRLAR